eukprot:1716182-Alexandrium_andersonii.AAC.1
MSNLPRSSTPTGAREVPEVALSYCFLTKDTCDKTLAVPATQDCGSRAILAHPALRKGRLRDDAVDQAVASIRRLRHHRR